MNRAFFGVRPLSTKDGLPTNAVYGTATIVNRHIEAIAPDYFAVAFDLPAPTFRHKYYDAYKSNRHGMPEDLAAQLPYIKELFEKMGAACLECEGYEADDILGTVARMAEEENVKTYIVTGDRDSLQLIDENTSVILATNTEPIEYDTEKFKEKYGVLPSQFVDVKALMGDSSDCIPGVAGIGEKTALSLIATFGSLDNIYEDLSEKPLTASVKAKLDSGKDSAYMSKYLATITKDAPIDKTIDELGFDGYDKSGLFELFTKLEFSALIKKFALEDGKKDTLVELCAPDAIDTEKISFYPDEKSGKFYVCDGKNVASFDDAAPAREFIKKAGKLIVYDKKSQKHAYPDLPDCDDVMLMAYVLGASENDYSLKKLVSREFLSETEDGDKLCKFIFGLCDNYLSRMSDAEKKLYFDIELPLCDVLWSIEKCGFKVDTAGLEKFSEQLDSMQKEYEQRIFMLSGEPFNINSPKQLGQVLFEKLGLPSGKKTKNGYSTSAEVLERLRPYSDIVDDILDYRQVGKFKSTYADGLTRAADENGRVHTSFRQALTATGRLSSTEPNLQNIPIKTELGREFRRYFIPENENYVLIDADYSQIELRLLAAISNDENMIDAFKSGYDIHTATAMKVFGVSADNVTVALRKRAKAINFGIVYGIGEYSLATDLHVSMKEAGEYIRSYFDTYPKVKKYLEDVVAKAKEDKFVTTLFGRRRYIPELSSTRRPEIAFGERVAMNSPIQGTAADIIKLAMVNISKKLARGGYDARLILQIQDELIIESNENCANDVAELLKSEMENAVSLAVPLTVSISTGKTWFDAK
ncbi:MAG: DNA polymerase I [Clostridiales bacterium]|nr:DNA polymerase I [Clostridiales bacterium]